MFSPISITEARAALLAACADGYISFADAAPIADYIAELEASQLGYIHF